MYIIAFISLRLFVPMEPTMEELSICRDSVHAFHEGCVAVAAILDGVEAEISIPSIACYLRNRDFIRNEFFSKGYVDSQRLNHAMMNFRRCIQRSIGKLWVPCKQRHKLL